jgi:putative FmdB family regulatory protein
MPLYVYRCDSCTREFELFHLMSETISSCQHCESEKIERIPQLISKPVRRPPPPPGSVVKKFIEDAKRDVKEQRREAKQEVNT